MAPIRGHNFFAFEVSQAQSMPPMDVLNAGCGGGSKMTTGIMCESPQAG